MNAFFLFLFLALSVSVVLADPILEQTTSIAATINAENVTPAPTPSRGGGGGGGGSASSNTQCDDDVDNDADGFCDYTGCYVKNSWKVADVNCESWSDNNESAVMLKSPAVPISVVTLPVGEGVASVLEDVIPEQEPLEETVVEPDVVVPIVDSDTTQATPVVPHKKSLLVQSLLTVLIILGLAWWAFSPD